MIKKKTVGTCIQCEGDEMLEVRKHASELISCMDLISIAYQGKHKKGTTVPQFMEALIEAERDQRRFREMYRGDAKRHSREIGELISALRFIADSCKHGSSGVTVGGNELQIGIADLLKTAVQRLESLRMQYAGLLDGRQPHNERDFIKPLLEP